VCEADLATESDEISQRPLEIDAELVAYQCPAIGDFDEITRLPVGWHIGRDRRSRAE
jgi:hypothetical protein